MQIQFHSWVGKISWRRKWQPTPVFFLKNPMNRGPGGLQSIESQKLDMTKLTQHTHNRNYYVLSTLLQAKCKFLFRMSKINVPGSKTAESSSVLCLCIPLSCSTLHLAVSSLRKQKQLTLSTSRPPSPRLLSKGSAVG